MYVTRHSNITDRQVLDDLWHLYTVAYERIATADITRETLFRSEFDAVMADPTNRTWVVREENVPISMMTIATDIGATRYLSRAYFDRFDRVRSAQGRVHYVMWIVSHPDHQNFKTLATMARPSMEVESQEGALLVFDLPLSNEPGENGRGAELFHRLARMVSPANLQQHGGSRYYAVEFVGSDVPSETIDSPSEIDDHANV